MSGFNGLAAVPVTFLLIRRNELSRVTVTSAQKERPVTVTTD